MIESPLKVELLLFETDPNSVLLWTRVAASHALRTTVVAHFGQEHVRLLSSPGVTVVDKSAAGPNFSSLVSQASREDGRREYIATGERLVLTEVVSMMHHGVAYALEKPLDPPRVAGVMDYVVKKLRARADQVTEYDELKGQLSELTQREIDVLHHVLEGTSNREAAEILGVSVRTVESRRAKLYRKLGAQSVAEVIRKVDRLTALSKEVDKSQTPIPNLAALSPHIQPKMSTVA